MTNENKYYFTIRIVGIIYNLISEKKADIFGHSTYCPVSITYASTQHETSQLQFHNQVPMIDGNRSTNSCENKFKTRIEFVVKSTKSTFPLPEFFSLINNMQIRNHKPTELNFFLECTIIGAKF